MKAYYLRVLTLMAVISTGWVQAKTFEETFNVAQGGKLLLRTDVGSLHIKTHSADTLVMEVHTKGMDDDEFTLEHQVSGSDVEITGKMKRRSGWVRNIGAKFYLTIPESYNLDLHTSGGSIDIEDLMGNIDAHTSGGSISVGNVTGDVELHTSGGSISTEAIYGPLDAHTSGGSINVTFAEQLTEDAELNTSGGSITAYLVDDIQVDLNASTSGGRVKSEFDVDGRVKKQSIRGEINGGGPDLKLHTSGGSIRIKSL